MADALVQEIKSGNVGEVKKLLDAAPALANSRDVYETHVLWIAMVDAPLPTRLNMVAMLLEHGADPNVRTNTYPNTWTPLRDAVSNRDIPLIEVLLKHGADPNAPMAYKMTPMHGIRYYPPKFETLELPMKAGESHSSWIARKRAIVDEESNKLKALIKDVLRLMIANGGRLDDRDSHGNTPLDSLPHDLQEYAKQVRASGEKRGLAEVSVKKNLPQNVTANIAAMLGKPPKRFLPGPPPPTLSRTNAAIPEMTTGSASVLPWSSSSSSNAASGKGRKTRTRKVRRRRTVRISRSKKQ